MTLGRLLAAWLTVAVWFAGIAWASRRLTGAEPALPWSARRAVAPAAEALLITLLASLWFDTLGSGEWWLPAGLIGALTAVPRLGQAPWRRAALALVIDVLRYVGAGAILTWRLGR